MLVEGQGSGCQVDVGRFALAFAKIDRRDQGADELRLLVWCGAIQRGADRLADCAVLVEAEELWSDASAFREPDAGCDLYDALFG